MVWRNIIEILIHNTYCELQGFNAAQIALAKKALSYKDEGAVFGGTAWDGTVCFLNAKNRFPTGLIHKLATEFKAGKVVYKILDKRIKPEKKYQFKMKSPFVPRDYQGACRPLVAVKQRGVILAGTGAGKSFMSAIVVDEIGLDTLIIVPDTGLRNQLSKDYIEKFFNNKLVGTKLTDNKPIIVTNIQAIAKADKSLFTRFGLLIMDEFHHSGAKSYRTVANHCINAFYRYGFTGTFVRPAGDEMEMHGVLSQVIMRVRTSDLIKRGYLTKPYIKMIEFNLNKAEYRQKNYMDAYGQLIKESEIHIMIAQLAQEFIKQGKQTLIIAKRIEHAQAISELIEGSFFLSGASKDREEKKQAFIDKKIKCIVATNIFGEGIDIPTIDVFMNTRFEKTEIQTKQGIGRALRLAVDKPFALVIDFLISGHRNLKDHSNKRLASYQSEEEFDVQVVKSHTEIFDIFK